MWNPLETRRTDIPIRPRGIAARGHVAIHGTPRVDRPVGSNDLRGAGGAQA